MLLTDLQSTEISCMKGCWPLVTGLRWLTMGQHFLLFCQIPTLPSMIASCLHLGGAAWVFQGFVVLGPVSGKNSGWEGGLVVGSSTHACITW